MPRFVEYRTGALHDGLTIKEVHIQLSIVVDDWAELRVRAERSVRATAVQLVDAVSRPTISPEAYVVRRRTARRRGRYSVGQELKCVERALQWKRVVASIFVAEAVIP